jgi:hypothetical protein
MTPPGGLRETPWRQAPNGHEVRVLLRRGFDCRERCEHVPPHPNEGGQNHGQTGDHWLFEYRSSATLAASVEAISYIRDGVLDRHFEQRRRHELRHPPGTRVGRPLDDLLVQGIMGAGLYVHRRVEGDDEGHACDILGRCVIDFAGYLFSSAFFERSFSETLEPLALHPFDEIDLDAVVDVMAPLWSKLSGFLAARSEPDL